LVLVLALTYPNRWLTSCQTKTTL